MNRRGHAPLIFTTGETIILMLVFWPAWLVDKVLPLSRFEVYAGACILWWIVVFALAGYGLFRTIKRIWRK